MKNLSIVFIEIVEHLRRRLEGAKQIALRASYAA